MWLLGNHFLGRDSIDHAFSVMQKKKSFEFVLKIMLEIVDGKIEKDSMVLLTTLNI